MAGSIISFTTRYLSPFSKCNLQFLLIFSAVVAGPDEKWGEHPVAFVVPKHGRTVTAGKVISFCKGRLAGFKVSGMG